MLKKRLKLNYQLYLMILLPFLWYVIFHYVPMFGLVIAFKDFIPTMGMFGSPWVGFAQFSRVFSTYDFWRLVYNTVSISLYALAVGFPMPIILALIINEIRGVKYKKLVQNITYIPHFLSVVVVVSMLSLFFNHDRGVVNNVLAGLGLNRVAFMEEPRYFKTIYVLSNVWENMGWNAIIYIAALSGIDAAYYEAASIDGASRLKQIWHISIPSIMPTIVTLFILRVGQLMNVGFEKILLMQNDLVLSASEVISTYVYRVGILRGDYSFSTTVGLINSVINCALIVMVNNIARRVDQSSLW